MTEQKWFFHAGNKELELRVDRNQAECFIRTTPHERIKGSTSELFFLATLTLQRLAEESGLIREVFKTSRFPVEGMTDNGLFWWMKHVGVADFGYQITREDIFTLHAYRNFPMEPEKIPTAVINLQL